jgi:hypothetical protein
MIIFTNILFIIIITSLLQSSAGHRPMIFGYSHSAPASCPAQIVSPLDLRESYTTFTETRSPFQNSFTPALVGSTADMASPLPFQHANTVRYVGAFSSLPEHSSFHSSLSDLELVDQPCRVSTSRLRMSWPVECTDWRLSSFKEGNAFTPTPVPFWQYMKYWEILRRNMWVRLGKGAENSN